MEDNNIDCEIVGLHDLLYKAIIFDEAEKKVQEEENLFENKAEE
jgi:hypothetical protein